MTTQAAQVVAARTLNSASPKSTGANVTTGLTTHRLLAWMLTMLRMCGRMNNLYRIHPQPAFNFGGLVIDNFAGGGGVQHE